MTALFALLSLTIASAETPQPGSADSGIVVGGKGTILTIAPQSADSAYSYLEWIVGQMDFYRANGYRVSLPTHSDFDASAAMGDLALFRQDVYRIRAFDAALSSLTESRETLEDVASWFSNARDTEGFRVFDQYSVELTLYGPGGSYDAAGGNIVLWTTESGQFKGGGGLHTIAHEMMHIAVEENFVQRFALSHWEKERLVDLLTRRELGHLLPGYELQPQGAAELDPFIVDTPLAELADALQRYRAR